MADISNKTLAVFLVVATIVSLGGFMVSYSKLGESGVTGRAATDLGDANFSINSSISVVFISNMVEFGSGIVNGSGNHNCTLNTSVATFSANDCFGFNAPPIQPLRIQNQGTQNVTLNVTFNATAAEFIGGTTPAYSWKASANDTTPCGGTSLNTTLNLVNAKDTNNTICGGTDFDWHTGSRTINLDLGLRIPQDAVPGTRKLRLTAHASTP